MPRPMCEVPKTRLMFPIEENMSSSMGLLLDNEKEPSTLSLIKVTKAIEVEIVQIRILKDGIIEPRIQLNEFSHDYVDERKTVPTIVDKYLAGCQRFNLVPNETILRCLRGEDETIKIQHSKMEPTNIYLALKNITDDNIISLTALDMSYNDSAENIFLFLNEMLTENDKLTWLNISNSSLSQECIDLLANAIENSLALTYLDITNCDIGDEGGALLMSTLKNNELLEEFHIGKNRLCTLTAAAMIPAMKNNRTLKILNLRWNDLFPEKDGAMKIAVAIKQNRGLENVNLSWNGLSGQHFAAGMATAIRFNKTLETLDLSNNILYGDEIVTILTGVQRSKNLKHIYFDNNVWDEFSMLDALRILKVCSKMQTVSIGKQTFVTKQFRDAAKLIMTKIPTLNIIYKGITLPNPPIESEFPAIVLDRAKYLSMKPKKKKLRRDFTDIMTTLYYNEKDAINTNEFLAIVDKFKPKLDEDLIAHLSQIFMRKSGTGKSKRKLIYIKEMAEYYFKRLKMEIPEPVDPEKYVEKKKKKANKKKNANKKK